MDEITLINLLNKICEKNPSLNWKLNCKYSEQQDVSLMDISLYEPLERKKKGFITFNMETGKIIEGRYTGVVPFSEKYLLVDALLDILHYESNRLVHTPN